MNCREIQDLLTPYLLGDLDPAQAANVRDHLQTCALCQASVEDLQATLQLLREGLADTSAVPLRLPEKFILQFNKRRWRSPWVVKRKPAPRRWWVSITELAAVAAVFLILAGLMLPNLASDRGRARRASDMANVPAVRKYASASPMSAARPGATSPQPKSASIADSDSSIGGGMLLPSSKAESIAHGLFRRELGGVKSYQKDKNESGRVSGERGGGSGARHGDTSSFETEGATVTHDIKSGTESKANEAEDLQSEGNEEYASTAPAGSDMPRDDLELKESQYGKHEPALSSLVSDGEESDIISKIGAERPAKKPASTVTRLTDDYAEGISEPPPTMSKEAAKAETKDETVNLGATVEIANKAMPRITVAAPADLERAETVKDTPPPKIAEVKVRTDMNKNIEGARVAHLQGVQKIQKSWDVSGEKRAISPVSGIPTNTVPAPEPAASNVPPVTVPICRATGVNPFVSAADKPFSTFSIDVDTASYSLSRNYLLRGQLPPPEAVRTEEFVNYFDYDYTPPNGPTFAVYTDCGPSAFGRGLSLLKIGVKGRRLGREEKRAAVLTLLIDTSGSMATPDRIELIKSALIQMVERLDPADKVAIVQYDSHARLLLEHTPAADKKRILAVIEGLQTSGSTALEEGMREAYATAARGFNSAGCNRVLLLSDGMANLGTTVAEDILKSIEGYRKQGVTLSVFGFGLGAYNDAMLETLANKGDGVYSFIDSPAEAKRVLVDDLAATVNLIARDVKIQVEFNPKRVKQYRQLGYENRQLKKEQFRDDSVDAGEIGSGQSVTALYELELQGDARESLGMVRIRCRNALTGQIEEIEQPITPPAGTTSIEAMDVHFRLAAATAEFSEILRGSPFAAGSRFEDVARVLRPIALELSLDNRIQELLRLTQTGLTPKFQEEGNP